MSVSGPTKPCPRCNTQLPLAAAFCGVCGWSFSAPAGAAPAPVASVVQSIPGSGPQSPPAPALAPLQPPQPVLAVYPLPGQPGAAGVPPGAGAPSPRQGLSRALLAIIVLAGLLTVAIPGFLVFGGHGSSLFTDRHGLPGNVPLPNGATFTFTYNLSDSSGAGNDWYWTVAGPNDPATIQQFYQSTLPNNGWTHIQTRGSNGDYEVTGCQGNQGIYVAMSTSLDVSDAQGNTPSALTGPAGGSALEILVSSQPDTRSYAGCS